MISYCIIRFFLWKCGPSGWCWPCLCSSICSSAWGVSALGIRTEVRDSAWPPGVSCWARGECQTECVTKALPVSTHRFYRWTSECSSLNGCDLRMYSCVEFGSACFIRNRPSCLLVQALAVEPKMQISLPAHASPFLPSGAILSKLGVQRVLNRDCIW